MTWRAHIEHRWELQWVNLHLFDASPSGYTLLGPGGETSTVIEDPSMHVAEPHPPALVIPEAAAPALLAALSRHLGSVEHPEQLRKDYDAERARVDRFIAHLTRAGVTA